MLGPFKASRPLLGGLLWKVPWRMSNHQKYRLRNRLKNVDNVIKKINLGLHVARCEDKGISYEDAISMKKKFKPRMEILRLLNKPQYFSKESQMSPKDKYTVFNRTSDGYRKGVHKVPKWTKVSNRNNPEYF